MNRKEQAVMLHKSGFNCAQSVACSFCHVMGADPIQKMCIRDRSACWSLLPHPAADSETNVRARRIINFFICLYLLFF